MAAGGRRQEIDETIVGWEAGLEPLRLWLANAPESVHLAHQAEFAELYRRKEVAKSRWEAIRGVYRPSVEAVAAVEAAMAEMESAWRKAEPLVRQAAAARD